ncbi:BRCT domain-containing DNA repair protein [Striga hermonthica]|uniref:BRCT domain-containing DNA repair protein n=1 Tax=Striga hermonthica TaxID=68872 RepID=A0A9N7N5K0_STRHE|nr:BRCT domain-containing DNA repair protein [Striga hermonthica]
MGFSKDISNRDANDSKNNNFSVDSPDFETQQVDSQCPVGDGYEIDDFQYLTNTMPVDECYLFEDEFETQYVNLAGETQVVDDVDETQVLGDLDCMKNFDELDTVAVNSSEGANKAEAFYETQVLSQDGSEKIDDVDSIGLQNTSDTFRPETFSRGFTSIRAASIRSSGLAAREHGAKRNSCPSSSDKSSLEQETFKKGNTSVAQCSLESGMKNCHSDFRDVSTEDTGQLGNLDKCKVACAAVRKLFKDVEFAEVDQTEAYDINQTDDNANIYSEKGCLAGLSYANSQEPGELSQAHALEVVDKFLDLNVMDIGDGVGATVQKAEKKTKIASGVKGSRELAKKSSALKEVNGEHGIYDWDDSREDDGGGEFFIKKKELFFENGDGKKRCRTRSKNPNGDEKERNCTKSKQKDLAYSDSGPMLRKTRTKGKTSFNSVERSVAQNYITKDLIDERLNVEVEPNLVETEKNKDNNIEMNDVGADTQMAAEAMETLCFEVQLSADNGTNNNPDTVKATRKNQLSDIITAHPEKCLSEERSHSPSIGVVTRKAKQLKMTRQITSDKPEAMDLTDLFNSRVKLTGQKSEKKRMLEDHSMPVAHRTRKSTELGHSKAGAKSFVTRNDLNRLVCIARKRTASKDENTETVHIKNDKKSWLSRSGASHIDAVDNNLPEERVQKENLAVDHADAQMTAEAMETCFEVQLSEDNGTNNNPDTVKTTRKNQSSDIITARPEESLTDKRPHTPSIGVVTRKAKQLKRTRESTSDKPSVLPEAMDLTVLSNSRVKLTGQKSDKKCQLEDHLDFSVPLDHRTRKGAESVRSKAGAKSFVTRSDLNRLACITRKRSASKDKNAETVHVKNDKKSWLNRSAASHIDAVDNLPEERVRKENLAVDHVDAQCHNPRLKRLRKIGTNFSLGTGSGKITSDQNVEIGSSRHDATQNATDQEKVGASSSEKNDEKNIAEKFPDATKTNNKLEASPPTDVSRIPANSVSPVCMGDEYHTQSCRKNLARLSLITEMNKAASASPGSFNRMKESRKRKDITNVRVLFSQHLDEDVIKHQKKILARLGGAVATLMSDASHFVADEFVRTRNMLEAIASGKPVVTHLWLESCGQASCLIDEKNYILRDSKKEREFGFCLPASLSRAGQHPLLQGQKVLITPNTKPGKDILANLVKAVHGLVIERVGRSVLKDEKLADDLLILSCNEDYDVCVPFLEKGSPVYSSELLLNGIVKQKLEYERHRLFDDHVKRTRSTIWMRKKNGYRPVTKCK